MAETSRQAGANDIRPDLAMLSAGAEAFRAWESDPIEQGKLNRVANMLSMVYSAMEAERGLSS